MMAVIAGLADILLGLGCGVAGVGLGYFLRGSLKAPSTHATAATGTLFDPQNDEALRRRNAIFAKVFNLVPETLTITRIADGRFIEVNKNWEAMTGFTREEGIGSSSAELGVWVVPEQRAFIIERIQRDGEVHDADVTFKHKKGQLYYNKVSASVFESDGEKYMLLAVQDVSVQREAQLQIVELNQTLEQRVQQRTLKLEQANAELAEALQTLHQAKDELVKTDKLAALGALVAGIAHELNTPIGNGLTVATTLEHRVKALDGQIASGLRRSELDQFVSDTRFAADVLVRNLMRAADLVLSFKQVAADRTSAQRRQFKLLEVVSETLVTLNPAIRRAHCTVNVDVDSALELDSYPGPLGQVLDNLLNNAMLHGFADGRQGVIWLTARALGPMQVEILVRDDGVGIAAENLQRIFDPFFTTRLGQGGSGLGLHIAYNIVGDILGGRIEVRSVAGEGATFVVQIPLTAPQPAPDAAAAE